MRMCEVEGQKPKPVKERCSDLGFEDTCLGGPNMSQNLGSGVTGTVAPANSNHTLIVTFKYKNSNSSQVCGLINCFGIFDLGGSPDWVASWQLGMKNKYNVTLVEVLDLEIKSSIM